MMLATVMTLKKVFTEHESCRTQHMRDVENAACDFLFDCNNFANTTLIECLELVERCLILKPCGRIITDTCWAHWCSHMQSRHICVY
jgi:hypothetical protein